MRGAGERAYGGRVPPIEPVAVVEDVGYLKSEQAPKSGPKPVDALKRHALRHGAPGAREEKLYGYDEHHQANDEPVGSIPMKVVGEEGAVPRLQFDAGEQDDVQAWEEYAHVACRRHPQLDIGHVLERALKLGHARHEAQSPHERQERGLREEPVAGRQHER